MANAILNSNSSSALISALDAVSSEKNPFVYSYGSSLIGSHVKAHAKIISTSQCTAPGFNQNNDFKIQKSGLLQNAWIKMTVLNSSGASAYLNAQIGNLQVAEISLISQGKVLTTTRPFGRACMASDGPYQVKKNKEQMYGIQAVRHTIADGASLTFYVPCEFAQFQNAQSYISTSFEEPQQVRVRLEAANMFADDGANPAVAVPLVLSKLELVQVFLMQTGAEESKTINENYSEDDLVKVLHDQVEESTQTTPTAATSQELAHTITTNRCVSKLFVAVEDTVDATATDLNSQALGRYLELSNIKITANGQEVLSCDAGIIGYALGSNGTSRESSSVSNYFDDTHAHTRNIYCIDFGLLKGTDTFTGMVSARELNEWKITVTTSASAAVTATAHNLRVMMVCPSLVSTSSASGKVSTSLSS